MLLRYDLQPFKISLLRGDAEAVTHTLMLQTKLGDPVSPLSVLRFGYNDLHDAPADHRGKNDYCLVFKLKKLMKSRLERKFELCRLSMYYNRCSE